MTQDKDPVGENDPVVLEDLLSGVDDTAGRLKSAKDAMKETGMDKETAAGLFGLTVEDLK